MTGQEGGFPDTSPLETIIPRILANFAEKNAAREQALSASRAIIRMSANAIRAVHRGEFEKASAALDEARAVRDAAVAALEGHGDVYHAGFLHDAQKEYAEARATLALLSGRSLPAPEDLGVDYPAYLNGIAEAVGEMRRMILDRLRRGEYEGCEALLTAMDDIYSVLLTIDYPDAMTGGLRRTTDQTRGILERTRGDLTMAIVQRQSIDALPRAADWPLPAPKPRSPSPSPLPSPAPRA
jgi:translin